MTAHPVWAFIRKSIKSQQILFARFQEVDCLKNVSTGCFRDLIQNIFWSYSVSKTYHWFSFYLLDVSIVKLIKEISLESSRMFNLSNAMGLCVPGYILPAGVVNSLSLILGNILYYLSNYVTIAVLLLIKNGPTVHTKSALLWAQITLCTLKQNTERYYLPVNRGKKLNNPQGCGVGDYEAAKLCWQLCCGEFSVQCVWHW